MSSTAQKLAATLDDLYRVDGKAELIAGRIVHFMATGLRPSMIAANIYVSLRNHTKSTGQGMALTDNMGFAVPKLASGRESFSPDAAYYDGPLPANEMNFVPGPPTFAVEVRSKGDYGNAAEVEMAAKRADYFEAGTKVVWDVDPLGHCVHSYQASDPDQAVTYHKGQTANAEMAIPGWTLAVDDLFA